MICTCPKKVTVTHFYYQKKKTFPVIFIFNFFFKHQGPERIKPSNKQTLSKQAYVYGPPCSVVTNYTIRIIQKGSTEGELQR